MLEIRTEGDKVLRQKAKRIANIDDSLRTLCASMCATMYGNKGIGLAAPQVGVSKRIIVVDDNGKPLILINPEIVFYSEDKVEMEEGCLSIPGEFKFVSRPETIKVKFRDTKGKPHFNTYNGLISRIIQHEVDHLEGVLMNDK